MASKQDLIDDLRGAHPELTRARATAFVNDLLATMAAALQRGDAVRLAGFGTFQVRARAARTARNPRTGTPVAVPATKVVRFHAASVLRKGVNTPRGNRRAKSS